MVIMFSKETHPTQNCAFLTIIKREVSDLNDPRNERSGQSNCPLKLFAFTFGFLWVLHALYELDALSRLVREAEMLTCCYAPNATFATVASPVTTAAIVE
jgi:hypothetical protein